MTSRQLAKEVSAALGRARHRIVGTLERMGRGPTPAASARWGAAHPAWAAGTAALSRLSRRARRELEEIAAAEARLDAGTFGVCERCHAPIALGRLRASPTTRFCVRCEAPPRRSRPIVHPTDFSPGTRVAFAKALEAARRDGAELILVYVVELPRGISAGTDLSRRLVRAQRAARASAGREFERLVARAEKAGVRARGVVAAGWPPEQIVRIAKARRADSIVMGTHGRRGVEKLLLGSVAARVVATAPCPVLTVPAP
jgi:nucleotide-binding universal stress UspA family protein/RNA polymerase-binding transcription factor DksA